MKLGKKLMCIALSGAMVSSVVLGSVGCGKEEVADNATTIEINYWKSGLGVDWLYNLEEKFEAAYPEYDVYLDISSSSDIFTNTIELGAQDNTIDLYLMTLNTNEYNQYLEPLNDVLNYKWDGESKSIKEKINPSILNVLKQEGTGENIQYKSLSYGGGLLSLVYNNEIIDGVNYQVPVTTDELKDVAAMISSDFGTTTYPFITFQGGGYWKWVYETWLMQYNGVDWYTNAFLKLDGSEFGFADKNSKELLLDDNKETGRYQILELLEELLQYNYNYPGSASADFTPQQTLFIKNKAAAFMPNGTWLGNEMKGGKATATNISFMRLPVFSAIIDNLETIDTDTELAALVRVTDTYDNMADVPLTGTGYDVSSADLKSVWEARRLICSVLDEHSAMIPNYATAKEGAKKFLQFMYSDQMIKEYVDIIHMPLCATPSDGVIAQDGWSNWDKECMEIYNTSTFTPKFSNACPLLSYAGIFNNIQVYEEFSRYQNPLTAEAAWESMRTNYNKNWEQYMFLAGL